MHEKLFESTISIKSYRPTLLFDKRCKNIKLWSKEEKSPPDNKKVGFKSNIEIVDQDLNVSSSTSCSDGDLSVDELKIDPQNQKEVTNESCLIISNVDCETNFITLIYNLNDKWIEWKIDCLNILILNSGVRVNVASQLKIGMIGNIIGIVNRESELELTCDNVMCLWFGDPSHGPCKEDGVILRRQNRLLVQLSTPPAARYTRIVLIHDEKLLKMADGLKNGDRVLVWYYNRILKQETFMTKILEGVAVI